MSMENVSKIREKCVGCKGCGQSCPKRCISMPENKEGFWYPSVDEKRCVECGLCLKKCPAENTALHRNAPKAVWALRGRDEESLMRSASGGASDCAARAVLQRGGAVYGAAYDENLAVRHIEITADGERERIQSSKYVQSDSGDSYSQVRRRLAEGKTVLYTGTPCQIAGLYAFLGGDPENLYTIDLICHGVPSPKLLEKYLKYQSRRPAGRVTALNFRSKEKRGWGTQYLLKIGTRSGSRTRLLALDRYGKHFMAGDCYRESCYRCAYADTDRVGDLTVGDFWGIAKSHPGFNSPKGVSSVFVNTPKGQELLGWMKPLAETEAATLAEGMARQHNLVRPSGRPAARDTFYREIDAPGFMERMRVGLQPKERLKAVLPYRLIQRIKSL